MKSSIVVLMLAFGCSVAAAQYEQNAKEWRVMPEIMVVRYLPGYEFQWGDVWLDGASSGTYRYSGFGGNLFVRFMNTRFPGLALTLSGGATSFYKPDQTYVYYAAAPGLHATTTSTLGGDQHVGDFFVFPVSIGLQGMWPFQNYDKFRVFAGVEASAYFVDGSVAPRAQTRFGYSAAGGFGVGIVELGARYSQFADMRNIGVFFGVCLKPYDF